MEIEVEWETKPKSGITNIHLNDLNCKNLEEWDSLDKKEQEQRLSIVLMDYDGLTLKIEPKEW